MAGRLPVVSFVIAVALACSAAPALAKPGDLDPTFGAQKNGKQVIDLGGQEFVFDLANSAVQPDGKIVFAGNTAASIAVPDKIVVERLLPSGSPDPQWSGDGTAAVPIAGTAAADALALQPDGKVVVVGEAGSRALAFRLNPDGSLDQSFGAGGIQTNIPGTQTTATSVALQPDGRIVVAGVTLAAADGQPADMWAARLDADGTPDLTFSADGQQTAGFAGSDVANAVALQPSGKIVMAGGGDAQGDLLAVRLNPDGSFDTSFGPFGTGVALVHVAGRRASAEAVVIEPDGQIDFAGNNGTGNFMITRMNADGSLDTSFGGTGTGWTGFSAGGSDFAVGIALQRDGKIIVGGNGGPNRDLIVVRYNADGRQDLSFGSGPFDVGTADFGTDEDGGAVAIDPNGQIVAIGGTDPAGGAANFAVARFDGDTPPKCRVPNVLGEKVAAAKDEIRSQNCAVGDVTRAGAPRRDRGRVIEQHPRGGKTFTAGKEVALVVGKRR